MRVLAVLALLPFLAGCTDSDWNRMLSFGGSEQTGSDSTEVAAAEPPPATSAPAASATATGAPVQTASAAPDPFCLGIARQDAMSNDFDTATQQKVAARSYQQCMQIFGSTE